MPKFDDYKNRYKHVQMERRDGILQAIFHTEGGPLKWGMSAHEELGYAFGEISRDEENKVVIITGTGDIYCSELDMGRNLAQMTTDRWDHVYKDAKHLLMNLLDIEVPVIAAVNGPALIHAEIPVLSDIVICSENAEFQDAPHFPNGVVPGDGVHVVWPLVLGANRGRYFLLTGQKLSAREALTLGVVSEIVTRDKLLPRAWELAEQIAKRPRLASRYARVALTQPIKRAMLDNLGYGLALEGLAMSAPRPTKA
jgi:enoyl-CoA hydratase/carnithine racemase